LQSTRGFFNFETLNNSRRYTLGKNERLKSRKAIEQLFAAGQSFSMFPFRVTWMAAEGTGNDEQGRTNDDVSSRQPSTINHQPTDGGWQMTDGRKETVNDEQGTEEFRTGSSSRQPPSASGQLNDEQGTRNDEFRISLEGSSHQPSTVNRQPNYERGTTELRNKGSSRQPPTVNCQPLQAAFTVPRRQFKKSVHRNRIKRLMREAWRLQKNPLQDILVAKGIQLRVFIVYTGRDLPEWTLVQEKVQRIIARLQKSIHEKPADHS